MCVSMLLGVRNSLKTVLYLGHLSSCPEYPARPCFSRNVSTFYLAEKRG